MKRDEEQCRATADRILRAMPDRTRCSLQDMVAELLCGGADEAEAMEVNEVARYLGRRPEYVRSVLQRLHRRVFNAEISA